MIKVVDARFVTSATQPSQYPRARMPEVAFAGRSNVGKSSMINALCGRKKLVRVSNTPGRTRTLNFFDVDLEVDKAKRTLRLCDLPGYGYAKAPKTERAQWQQMISRYLQGGDFLHAVVAIVDAEVGAQPIDVQLVEWLQSKGPPILVAGTKIDRIAKSHRYGALSKIAVALAVPMEAVVGFSATEKLGVDEVWDRLVGATLMTPL